MPKLTGVEPREKIPRKAKSNVIGIDEINMIKEVLKNERAVSRRLHKKVSEKNKKCEETKQATLSNSQCLIEKILNEESEEKNISNKEESEIKNIKQIPISNIKVNEVPKNRLNNSDLSHFMDLEERKDLLASEHDSDPLSINGPETYDGVGWVAVKQEVPDDIEISHMTITEIPLKSDTDVERFSSLPSPSPTPLPEIPESEESNEIKCEVVMDSKEDAVKNEDVSNSPDDSWWDDGPDSASDDKEETDNNFKVIKKVTNKHKQIKKYKCDICDKKLSTRGSLRIHKRNKHKITMTFRCELCSLNFDLRKELIKHRNETHKDKNGRFTCSECGKLINDYHNYLNHMKAHVDNDEFFYKGEYWKDSVKCEQCNKVFKNEESLRVHKAMLHDNGLLNEKLKLQEKNYVCNTCGKRFAFSCLLKDHVNLHTGVKPYLCQSCGRSFSQKASLKQHARTHNSVRPFQCTVCTQGFFGNGDLKKHMRKHTGERPYVCEMCGDGFSQSSHLGVHRRSHTGERPYKCDVCSRGFTKKGDVVRHRRIHTGELPYLCQVCGKAFRQSTQCVNHIKHHHPESLVSVARNPAPGLQWVF